VNDRLCDCCDGSDEFASGATCPNTCNAAADREGREAKAREERRVAGIKARLQLVETAKLRRADIKIQLKQESDNLAELEKAVAAREAEKKVCEAEELSERQEIKKKSEADYEVWKLQRSGANSSDGAATVTEEASTIEASFPNIICAKWRQTRDCRGDGDREPKDDKDCTHLISDGWSGFCECVNTDSSEEVLHRFDCGHKKLTCDYVCKHDGEEPAALEEEKKSAEETFKVDDGSSYESERAREARRRYSEENSKKIASENKIKDLEKDLSRDFGPEDAFLPLNGECFDLDEREYTYKFCPFKDVQQIKKGAGYGPNMGRFKGFAEQSYSLWGAKSDYTHMLFTEGESCWGGPARSTDVHLVCGEVSKIVRVEEPSMCTYKMVFETPVVCE
jgi:protein kinase C substrate 80K-H